MARDILAFPALAPAPAGWQTPPLAPWSLDLAGFPIHDREFGVRVLRGYAEFWVDHMGGPERAAQHVLAAFGGGAMDPPPSVRDRQERVMALFATAFRGWPEKGAPPAGIIPALAIALGLLSRVEKLHAALLAGRAHPVDAIFAAGAERDTAASIAAAVATSLDDAPRDVRWALWCLLDAYARRARRPCAAAFYALAGALGLLDPEGRGRANLALGGVVERRALIALAAEDAFSKGDDDFEFDATATADPRTEDDLRESPIYDLAFNHFLGRLGDRVQKIRDHSAADS